MDDLLAHLRTLRNPSNEEIRDAQLRLNELSSFAPAYEVKKAQELIDAFSTTSTKGRFTFKNKSGTRVQKVVAKKVEATKTDVDEHISSANGVVDVTTHTTLKDTDIILIKDLNGCTIDLDRGRPYASITLRSLKDCQIHASISTSSILIDSCHRCKVSGAAQQWRIHSSNDCEIEYSSSGPPIIEDCSCMAFKNTDGLTEVIDFSDLSGTQSNWRVIQS